MKRLRELAGETRSMLFFESVHRIKATLADLCEVLGVERNAFVGRELSKMHEQCVSSTLGDIGEMVENGRIPTKGEFVLVVAGNRNVDSETTTISIDRLIAEISAVLPLSQAADLVSSLSGRRRNEIYRLMLAQREN